VEELMDWLRSGSLKFGTDLIIAIAILAVGLKLSRWVADKAVHNPLFEHFEPNTRSFISSTLLFVLRAAVIACAALRLGVPGTVFITLFGSLGVAVSLATQGTLSNVAGGLMILVNRPFVVGDYIVVGSYEGTVRQISAFYTTIVTADNRTVLLPNGTITNSTMINCSSQPVRMVEIPCSVGYRSDPARVRKVLLDVAENTEGVLTDPAPQAPMTEMGDSALKFTLRAWVRKEDFLAAKWALTEGVKRALDEAGLDIPYPQMDIHVIS